MGFAVVVSVVLVAYTTVVDLAGIDRRYYAQLNLGVAGLVLTAAALVGLVGPSLGDLSSPAGWILGAVCAVVTVTGLLLLRRLARTRPGLRRLLSDRRAAGLGGHDLTVETLVRIPLGTVVLEEVAFRGVLFAALDRAGSTVSAILWSSAVFGLWHVGSTLVTLRTNRLASSGALLGGTVLGVVVTALGGVWFCALRVWGGGLVAPTLAHWSLNATALWVAATVQRERSGIPSGDG